ncbi:DUF2852 domain-containing protein [Salinarimonas chemoclinalis]|uniref:DUF2852 domain-containing protein n=1 Tax=Salinarimonas chemoclinalis TaxID=3241599 RepID=UPI003556F7EC
MQTTTMSMSAATDWIVRCRDWLDERGKGAWIAAIVAGFIVFWPIGLGLLLYMIGSKRMACKAWGRKNRHAVSGATGNAAFDSYRAETLKRLEEERDAFMSFLEELRQAKDRAEFDQFMARRSGGGNAA